MDYLSGKSPTDEGVKEKRTFLNSSDDHSARGRPLVEEFLISAFLISLRLTKGRLILTLRNKIEGVDVKRNFQLKIETAYFLSI